MKYKINYLFSSIFILSLLAACEQTPPSVAEAGDLPTNLAINNSALLEAFKHKKSDIFIEGAGVVKKLLLDDNKGSRHQKFLVSISPEQTLLFAHNIDLAPRVENLQIGDSVSFKGEYEYNPKGGVMHWTHKDPQTQQSVGWIKHNGKIYE